MAPNQPVTRPAQSPQPPTPAPAERQWQLPTSIVKVADVGRMIHELEQLDDKLLQTDLRKHQAADLPAASRLLEQLVSLNKLDLVQAADRAALARYLQSVHTKAPVMHMSFSVDPSVDFIEQLVVWIRRKIAPNVLLNIGLQPNIGAGCSVRSTNQYFDLSLRQAFASHRKDLLDKLIAVTEPSLATPAPAAAQPPMAPTTPAATPTAGVAA